MIRVKVTTGFSVIIRVIFSVRARPRDSYG
jgi:hypothetical protein